MQDETRQDRITLAGKTAEALRLRVFASTPGDLLGSLRQLAAELGVGIVTVQQAARVLEHEGLLAARRGPGGGYYAARPDASAVERAVLMYLRTHPASFGEALNLTSLLFIELAGAAANCDDAGLRRHLAALIDDLEACAAPEDWGRFEAAFQDLLFRMVDWPLFELLTRVTLNIGVSSGQPELRPDATWKAGRGRIIAAILAGDPELARFEAERSNRRAVLAQI